MEKVEKNQKVEKIKKAEKTKITLVILAAVLLFLFFLLWRQYAFFKKIQSIQALRAQISTQLGQIAGLRQKGSLTAADASYIQSWMTFDYIDVTFGLPPLYLENSLNIHNPQYPHISIAHYARVESLDPTVFTTAVIGAVRTYLASSSVQVSVPASAIAPAAR